VCCSDDDCLKEVGDRHEAGIADYSAVRVLVLLDNVRIVKPFLVVRNLGGGLAGIARVRVMKFWTHPDGAPLPTGHDFSDWGDDDDTSSPERATPERFDPMGRSASDRTRTLVSRAQVLVGPLLSVSVRVGCLVSSCTRLSLSGLLLPALYLRLAVLSPLLVFPRL
jgi:hypothetical protein